MNDSGCGSRTDTMIADPEPIKPDHQCPKCEDKLSVLAGDDWIPCPRCQDPQTITIKPCCWVCDESALLPRLISTGAVELWCDYPTTQRIISDGINDMPGFTTCCGHFQLKKELAG